MSEVKAVEEKSRLADFLYDYLVKHSPEVISREEFDNELKENPDVKLFINAIEEFSSIQNAELEKEVDDLELVRLRLTDTKLELEERLSATKSLMNQYYQERIEMFNSNVELQNKIDTLSSDNESLKQSNEEIKKTNVEAHDYARSLKAQVEKLKGDFSEYTQQYQLNQSETTNALYKELGTLYESNRKLRGLMEQFYKLRDLWLPDDDWTPPPQHEGEYQVLGKLLFELESLLNQKGK